VSVPVFCTKADGTTACLSVILVALGKGAVLKCARVLASAWSQRRHPSSNVANGHRMPRAWPSLSSYGAGTSGPMSRHYYGPDERGRDDRHQAGTTPVIGRMTKDHRVRTLPCGRYLGPRPSAALANGRS
jgi:hypothetical protein